MTTLSRNELTASQITSLKVGDKVYAGPVYGDVKISGFGGSATKNVDGKTRRLIEFNPVRTKDGRRIASAVTLESVD